MQVDFSLQHEPQTSRQNIIQSQNKSTIIQKGHFCFENLITW